MPNARRPRSPMRRAALGSVAAPLAVMALAAVPSAARAQSSFSYSYVYQYADQPNQYQSNSICFASDATTGAVAANIASCNVLPNPASGLGSAVATTVSSYDPAAGTFKSGASLHATNYTLSQFVPQYDANGDRIYTGASRPDALGVYSAVLLSDYYSLNAAPGAMPATISFFLDINGTLQADAQPNGASSYAGNFVNFCTAALGICGGPTASTDAFYGGSYMSLTGDGQSGFLQQSFAPAGGTPASISFAGAVSATSVNGRLTLADIPIVAGSPFDFVFAFGTEASVYHPSAHRGNIPVGCDPATDPSCTLLDPVDVNGTVDADFTHTLTFSGYRVLDANGNDITSQVQLTFASGLTPNAPVTATPEPATIALLGAGLAALGGVARRRRRQG